MSLAKGVCASLMALAFMMIGAVIALGIEEGIVDHNPSTTTVTVIPEPVMEVVDYEPATEEFYTVYCVASRYYCDGTPYADVIYGTNSANFIRGWGGGDKILARGGNDIIVGGRGRDAAWGFAGRDKFRMAGCLSGGDFIHGGTYYDTAEVTLADRWDDKTEFLNISHCS